MAVSNEEYYMPFEQKAARDLKGSRFVCLTEAGQIDYPGEGGSTITNKAQGRILGVLRANTKKGQPCAVGTFPGQKFVVELGEAAATAVNAGDTLKAKADGTAVKAAAGDPQSLKLGIVAGPVKAANKANVYTAIILR